MYTLRVDQKVSLFSNPQEPPWKMSLPRMFVDHSQLVSASKLQANPTIQPLRTSTAWTSKVNTGLKILLAHGDPLMSQWQTESSMAVMVWLAWVSCTRAPLMNLSADLSKMLRLEMLKVASLDIQWTVSPWETQPVALNIAMEPQKEDRKITRTTGPSVTTTLRKFGVRITLSRTLTTLLFAKKVTEPIGWLAMRLNIQSVLWT